MYAVPRTAFLMPALGDPVTEPESVEQLRAVAEERWRAHTDKHDFHDEAHAREHDATELALKVATAALDKRLDSMNDLQTILRNQADTFMRREAFELFRDGVAKQIDDLKEIKDRTTGAVNTWRFIAGFLGLSGVVAIIYALLNAPQP